MTPPAWLAHLSCSQTIFLDLSMYLLKPRWNQRYCTSLAISRQACPWSLTSSRIRSVALSLTTSKQSLLRSLLHKRKAGEANRCQCCRESRHAQAGQIHKRHGQLRPCPWLAQAGTQNRTESLRAYLAHASSRQSSTPAASAQQQCCEYRLLRPARKPADLHWMVRSAL